MVSFLWVGGGGGGGVMLVFWGLQRVGCVWVECWGLGNFVACG